MFGPELERILLFAALVLIAVAFTTGVFVGWALK